MEIAFVHPSFHRFGGAEGVTLAWLEQLAARGHRVRLLALQPPRDPLPKGCTAIPLAVGPLARRVRSRQLRIASVARRMVPHLAGAERIVASNYPSLRWIQLALRKVQVAPPVIWYCHEPYRRLHHPVTDARVLAAREREGFGSHLRRLGERYRTDEHRGTARERRREAASVAQADAIAANSTYTAGLVRALYGRDATPLPGGVSVPATSPDAPREPLLVAVSPFNAVKNVHMAVWAFCRLAAERPDLRLLCIGEGHERPVLEAHLAEHGLSERASLPGYVTPEELSAAYGRASIVLYPSVDEPLGLVPLEAAAHGAPVVASDHGGPAETVVDGKTGFLADPLDVTAWVECIANLLDDPARARSMGEGGRARVLANYRKVDCLERMTHLVEESKPRAG
jgi:glycosyltransferase involved in cell wall biosynthesis